MGLNFPGFIRPVISFAGVTRSAANATAFNDLAAGKSPPGFSAADVQSAFLHGWTAYFVTVAAVAIGLLVLAVVVITAIGMLWKKIRPGWFRWLRAALPRDWDAIRKGAAVPASSTTSVPASSIPSSQSASTPPP